ncbi:LysR family transcriptional regulator [Bordetella sp. BOR01]|uniref:LysR family transcriptional regulator n=1 Tax=Bordetella sp. BOR01 TaxID=2854779 RepID=UPI001C456040|nr:LysR family transcriptional regulator [Bordetella sp. BOR01]MBV7486876.1 LysR family transcriptional regulator [Bordetella sp. BOR01]
MSSIRVLRSFIEVARCGSFAAASEHVSLTPAAVGLQIHSLESDLGYPLFDRIGKSITLNQRGHRLVPRIQQLLMQYDALRLEEADPKDLAGSIKVASIATSMSMVVKAVLRIRRQYPRLSVEPGISYSGDLVSRVKEGELDAAVSVKNAHKVPAGVLWTHLYREPLVFIASKHAARQGDIGQLLAQRLFLRVSRSSNTGTLIDEFMRRRHLKAAEFLEMNAMRTIVDMVKEDMGVTILPLPRGTGWDHDPELHVQGFDDPTAHRSIGLFENESRCFLSSVLREYLVEELGRESPAGPPAGTARDTPPA